MVATIKASKEGREKFKEARENKRWNQEADALLTQSGVRRSTVQALEQGRNIRQENFVALFKAVGIKNWETYVDNSATQASYMEFLVCDDGWVGRETLIDESIEKVCGSCRVLLIVGITGIGKTALAERVVQELRGDWREHRDNFEDEKKVSDFASVALQWLEKWGESVPKDDRKPEQLLRRLVKHLRENRYLILMDSLEYLLTGNAEDGWGDFADEWWGKFFVSFLAESDCQSRFILTSQDLPTKFEKAECDRYKNRWYCQLLKGLEIPEQVELFQKAELDGDLELAHSPLRVIGEVYDGHPLALRTIAGEIKESYGRKVSAYWKENSRYIEEVKEAIDEARDRGIVKGDEDRWQLASYTKVLRRKVKERIDRTFDRLKNDAYDAYCLLCMASIYRCEVKETWWLINLEDEGYSEEQQKAAMQTLRDRYLVEDGGIDDEDNRLVGQHNLIRSVAIDRRLMLPKN
ncbi:MAG: ATP-binding protein [Microcoleus sp. PH2017_10_PVI_O_A]|uniref:helix-turn-helix domain-containing protein n=1 Tax=unclassified Microcoleus TaxID=2642155 RepID=UPI001DA2E9AE|nr:MULTISPECIES: helix-turn-helix domain-containing protein [unclassified Microcoleus]TAE81992.1 MAG: helix-turn-helix domain-containing protein [Oscillatoriales cyanobacterium]MCC3406715.1 ATP-binding protein [Microcoleus sp. PH2017_10_PVI_O_A]MCC3460711.1 ATP-binding protein [Microcoleus sp. PH2017_11_PCY_U_A]MCC3479274.1 ATP-binding protein [Microcoleus sp. PH2017_12_PCY_D_A]MCC3528213.1 ATP-binding protein [Microcoleus sp. PH2017_21_RUC_O_A]